MDNLIRVLVVDDDPTVVEIHCRFVMSIEGYTLAGSSTNGLDALRRIESTPVDLVILDIYMPELDGVETIHEIRRSERNVDVIVVSASHEVETFTEVSRAGAFDYIVKPFTYDRFRAALESYRSFRRTVLSARGHLSQQDIDAIMNRRREKTRCSNLPKGLSPIKLKHIIEILRQQKKPLSADEAAALAGVSRVTARRYLEYLVSSGEAVIEPFYKDIGRPVNLYRLIT
ncbi:MAG: Transcriptional regulatory protein [Synergistales bacterium 53_16]|nr:MAG: Transcriptional regulatory protein [Synergistales bacterium 53_16]